MIGGASVADSDAFGGSVDEEVVKVVDAENVRDRLNELH